MTQYLTICGNGRVMALLVAAKEHPANIVLYRNALKRVALGYGLPIAPIDSMKLPVLVRLLRTPVDLQAFAEECNARPTIETSSIEKARTDADKITPAMLTSIDVLEGEPIEKALRSERNKPFVSAYLSKVPENEQAGLIDSRGYLSSDGIRRMVMGIFTATFKGDVGIKLAEKFFEAIDETGVKNAFNGILKSLGIMAQAENLVASSTREPGLAFGEDLAKAMTVFSNLRGADMSVANYLAQAQLLERQLTPFQETVLKTLDEHTRSAKRIGNILSYYAQAVIDSPPPGQVQMIPGPKPDKALLFAAAVKRAVAEAEAERIEREAKKRKEPEPAAMSCGTACLLLAAPTISKMTIDKLIEHRQKYSYHHMLEESLEDSKKSVYHDIYDGWRDFDEAWNVIKEMREDEVIFSPEGFELSRDLLFEGLRDISEHPDLSPWGKPIPVRYDIGDLVHIKNHPDWIGRIRHIAGHQHTVVDPQGNVFYRGAADLVLIRKDVPEMEPGGRPAPEPGERHYVAPVQARLFDYSWLAKKIDKCNLSIRDVDAALNWKPLRELIATAARFKAKISLCSIGIVYGMYQLTIDGIKYKAETDMLDRFTKQKGIRRVYTAVPTQRVYEVVTPRVPKEKETMTWTPQEISHVPAKSEGAQAAMFDYTPNEPKGSIFRAVGSIIPERFEKFHVGVNLERSKAWNIESAPLIKTPEDAQQFFEKARQADREWLLVICLDVRLRLVGLFEQSIGTATMGLVSPQELARVAVLTGATSLILAHNHPSGDPVPSEDDLATFEEMKKALKLIQIEIPDFFVIGHTADYSMSSKNTLRAPAKHPFETTTLFAEAKPADPLLATITSQICSTGACLMAPKGKLPICSSAKAKKRESCIMSVKEHNVEAGCKPEGTGSKKCPVPFAVCNVSIGCHLGGKGEK